MNETILQEEMKYSILVRHYENEAKILGLDGNLSKIHVAQYVNELKDIPILYKTVYCKIIGIEYENDELLMNQKIKNGELLKLYSFVDSILFDSPTIDVEDKIMTEPLFFYSWPTPRQVRLNGIEYYYRKVGSATIEQLGTIYSKFELLFMAAFLHLFVKQEFIVNENVSKEGLASIICSLIEDLPLDPRMILTMYGPRVIHNNTDYNLNSLDNPYNALHSAGLETANLSIMTMYKRYCMSQVCASLFSEVDHFRQLTEQIEDRRLLSVGYDFEYEQVEYKNKEEFDKKIEENIPEMMEDYLYYGLGDGMTSYTPIKKNELDVVLKGKSHSLIRKAIYLLGKEKKNDEMIRKLFRLLEEDRVVSIQIKDKMDLDECRVFLTQMFNIGMQFMNYNEELLSYNPIDIYLRMNVEPIIPIWTDRMKSNISTMLDYILVCPVGLKHAPIITLIEEEVKQTLLDEEEQEEICSELEMMEDYNEYIYTINKVLPQEVAKRMVENLSGTTTEKIEEIEKQIRMLEPKHLKRLEQELKEENMKTFKVRNFIDELKYKKVLQTVLIKKYKTMKNETMFEVGNFGCNLKKLLELGLYDALFGFGVELVSTSNYYHYMLFGNSLTLNGITVDEVSGTD